MPDSDEICVLDAVVCVHFTGANLHPMLIDVLARSGLTLLIPREVCDEVAGKDRKYPGLRQRWARLEASGRIQVLPRLEIVTAPARVIEVIEDIRGLELERAVRTRRDLGEVVVIAHCVHLAEQGRHVIAALDDQEGQRLASVWNVPVITVEDILTLAIHLGHFPTVSALRQAYTRLREFGDGLLPLEKTPLIAAHTQWRQTNLPLTALVDGEGP